jgi:porin
MTSQARILLLSTLALLLISDATAVADGPTVKGNPAPPDIPLQLDWPSDHLLGGWLGLRTQMENTGIKPTLTLVTDFAWNPIGGRSQGSTQASNLGLDLQFDLDKLAGIRGGSFLFQMSERFGNSLSKEYIGNVFTTQQIFGGGETFRVVDVAYQQKLFDDRVEFRLGRLTTGDDFLVSPYDYLFMQNGICGNPVGIFFDAPGMTNYPIATWAAVLKVKPTPRSYVMFGAYNGDPAIHSGSGHGVDLSLNGPLFAIGEVGFQINGLAGDSGPLGNYKAGVWYDNTNFADFKSNETTRGSWGIYGLFDQVLIPFDDAGSNRGLGVFGAATIATDRRVAQMPFVCSAGVVATGIFDARPADTCGLGVVYGHFSGDLQDAERLAQQVSPNTTVQDYEAAVELTYRFYFKNRSVFFQPDLQYIVHPGGTGRVDDALLLGVQLGINF